jgi:hypothetical protein
VGQKTQAHAPAPHRWLGRGLRHDAIEEVHLTHWEIQSFHRKASVALIGNLAIAAREPLPATFAEVVASGARHCANTGGRPPGRRRGIDQPCP